MTNLHTYHNAFILTFGKLDATDESLDKAAQEYQRLRASGMELEKAMQEAAKLLED